MLKNDFFDELLDVIKIKYNNDLSKYSMDYLLKTIDRRMECSGVTDYEEYCSFFKQNDSEAEIFLNNLNNTYSYFFRDKLSFALLEQYILPDIAAKKSGGEIRIWTAGCSTGQEAYSIAILIQDLIETRRSEVRYRILATDISSEAVSRAKSGKYDEEAIQNITLKHYKKYFAKNGREVSVIPEIKKYIDFATYDLLDINTAFPPESIYGEFDIVFCRNLLIYYRPDIQEKIISKLQNSLSNTGFLVTGQAEKILVERLPSFRSLLAPAAIFERIRGRDQR